MNFIPYIILLIVVFLSLARAENYERAMIAKEKDFQLYEQKKIQREKHKYDGLEAWLKRRERLEERKRRHLNEWLEKKRGGGRAPAATLEEDDELKREAWRSKNAEYQKRFVQSQINREETRQKVLKDFDSKEVRRRENKPWR